MFQLISCSCGKKYKVDDSYAGRAVKCKACGRALLVPARLEPEAAYELADQQPDLRPPLQPTDSISSLVVNRHTYASNPGRTRINFGKFISCYPAPIVMFAVTILACVIGGPSLFILPVAALVVSSYHLLAARAKLRTGDINPAMVISTKPWRIAVYTDLTTGQGSRPCIKIVNAPLGRMTGGPPALAARLAVASLYAGRAGEGAWRNFAPMVVACAVTNQADIDRVTASISATEWRLLEQYLQRVPARKPGLYRMW